MGIKQTCANFNEISAKILACLQPPPPLKTNISELEFFLRGVVWGAAVHSQNLSHRRQNNNNNSNNNE